MSQLEYALFTGCSAKQSTPELLSSTLAVANKLEIKLTILQEASCCGASNLQDYDDFLALVLNARNLCYAQSYSMTLVTICNTCNFNLAMTKYRLDNDDKLKDRINEKLKEIGLEYQGGTKVKHFLHTLIEDYGLEKLKTMVTTPLSQFNIAPFYGCHDLDAYSSHENISKGAKNLHKSTYLDELIAVCGGKAIDYEEKYGCCGFHTHLQSPNTSNKLAGNILIDAVDRDSDYMITTSPLSHLQLDARQKDATKAVGRDINLPILHMPQMIGLALGCDQKDLGLKQHITKVNFL